jgi:hypothetical protein
MTIYRVYTRIVNENCYDIDMTLPVDMGEAGPRLTDRLIRQAADNETLNLLDAQMVGAVDEGPEEIREITRDDKVIWPMHRKRKTPRTMTVSDALACKPGEGPDPEDVASGDDLFSGSDEE